MRRVALFLLAALVAGSASAQTTAGAQTSASAMSKASVSVGKSGVQAQSDTSVAASQQTPAKSGGKQSASAQGSANSSTSASAQAGQNSVSLASGTTIQAALAGSLDARKAKAGDEVVARTTQTIRRDGRVVLPKGTRLVGHVTQARARAEGQSESALGIAFDRAVMKGGRGGNQRGRAGDCRG